MVPALGGDPRGAERYTEAPLLLMRIWREVFINEGLATVYIPRFAGITAHRRADQRRPAETCEIMQLDGTMAGATALLEMLVHTRAGTVHVFPAVSRHWPDVDFAQVRVPGGFLVSGSRRHGRTARVEVSNPSGGRIRIMVADQPTMTMIREGEPPGQVALPAELELAAGSSVRLEAGGSGLR